MTNEKLLTVDIRRVKRPALPVRQNFNEEELQSLVESIREKGILVPLMVRPVGDDFETIDGDRRLEASWRLKLSEIPVMVRLADDRETLSLRVLANLDRTDPDPVSEAHFFAKAIAELGTTVEDFANLIHRKPSFIESRLTIAEMPQYLLDALQEKKISLGVALKLFDIKDEQTLQRYVAHAISDGMTIMGAEQAVNQFSQISESYEQAGQEMPSDAVPEPPPVVVVQCARCGGTDSVAQMRVVRVHKDACPTQEGA